MEKEQKIPFFKRMVFAIKYFDKYENFAAEKFSTAVRYFLILILLFSLITTIGVVAKVAMLMNRTIQYTENEMPEFSYKEGVLAIKQQEAITLEDENNLIQILIMDTRSEVTPEKITEYTKRIEAYDAGVVLLRDKMLIKMPATANANTYTYTDVVNQLGITEIENKQDFITMLKSPNMYMGYVTLFIVFAIYNIVLNIPFIAIDMLLFASLAYLVAILSKFKMKFSSCYAISIYAFTLPILLRTVYVVVNLLTGFYMKYFDIMYYCIAMIYVVTAVLMIKSDLIKQQVELMKILEEQERVKAELEEKKREEERKKEKEEQKRREKEQEKQEEEAKKQTEQKEDKKEHKKEEKKKTEKKKKEENKKTPSKKSGRKENSKQEETQPQPELIQKKEIGKDNG